MVYRPLSGTPLPKLFCALNFVVHDLNCVSDVRNTTETVKHISKLFRDSPMRRRLVPNETRWSAKYKGIRIFSWNFSDIHAQLKANQREYALDGESADVCCGNHSVPHLPEDYCEVLNSYMQSTCT